MTSKAFCPAHITGFFTVSENHLDPEMVGSRGAGFSIDMGAHAEVDVGGTGWSITVNGKRSSFLLVEKVVRYFAPGGSVDIITDVPFSQGLGMSGACALSVGLAVCAEIGRPREDAVREAHRAEVFCRTGLGDVVAQSQGGFEVRLKEGLPPNGEIKKIEIEKELVIAVLGQPLLTADVLNDLALTGWVNMIGGDCMADFITDKSFDNFLELSNRFAHETEFIKGPVRHALMEAQDIGKGSMCMIGNSVFFTGDINKLYQTFADLTGHKNVFIVKIDNNGARLVESSSKGE